MTSSIPAWGRGVLWVLVAMGGGFVSGVVFERQRGQMAPASAMDPANVMHVLDSKLTLDSAQHAGVAAVLARRQAAIDSAWKILQPGIRAAVDSSQMEIVRVLHPDQVARFLQLIRSTHPPTSGVGSRP
jgi:hypothetical protein